MSVMIRRNPMKLKHSMKAYESTSIGYVGANPGSLGNPDAIRIDFRSLDKQNNNDFLNILKHSLTYTQCNTIPMDKSNFNRKGSYFVSGLLCAVWCLKLKKEIKQKSNFLYLYFLSFLLLSFFFYFYYPCWDGTVFCFISFKSSKDYQKQDEKTKSIQKRSLIYNNNLFFSLKSLKLTTPS